MYLPLMLSLLHVIPFCKSDITVGSLSQNVYRNTTDVIIAYDKMGLKMCGRYCKYQASCVAINYNPSTLVCELLKSTGQTVAINGNFYSELNTWIMDIDPCNPNTCSGNGRCTKTTNGGYYCQSIDTPCGHVVCQNGGSCKNDVASFTCFCPIGWSGTYCQFSILDKYLGEISSANYPNNYNNLESWAGTLQVSSGYRISLNFTEFVTEATYDILTVYDGTSTSWSIRYIMSGSTSRNITSTGMYMYITWTTDFSNVYKGWHALYYQVV